MDKHDDRPLPQWTREVCLMLDATPLIIDISRCSGSVDLRGGGGEWGRGPGWGAVACFAAGPHHLLPVTLRFDQKNVTLGQENAGQQAEAGGQDGEDLDSHHELPTGAEVRRHEGDPHDEEDEHAEGHALGLTWRKSKQK